MKKLTAFITSLTTKIYQNNFLRISLYVLVIALLLALFLFTDGQKIEFVYNDF